METASPSPTILATAKSVVLHHDKEGTHIILLEMPAGPETVSDLTLHTYDLGRFSAMTARAAVERLRFRFATPGKPLTSDDLAAIEEEIRRRPF